MFRSRYTVGRAVTGVAAAGFLATALIHSTGFHSVAALALEGPAELAALMPALWLVFSFDLVVLGLILAVAAFRPSATSRWMAGIASLCPLGAAGLQLWYIGFIPPTAILLAIGVLAASAALVLPRRLRQGKSG